MIVDKRIIKRLTINILLRLVHLSDDTIILN